MADVEALERNIIALQAVNEILENQLREKEAIILAERTRGVVAETKLTAAEKLRVTVKLRTQIEKLEELMRPPDMSYNEWQDVPRVQKWLRVLQNPELWETYIDLSQSILSVFNNDVMKAANAIKKLYGILNARTHNYFDDQPITNTYRELKLKKLADCLDSVDV